MAPHGNKSLNLNSRSVTMLKRFVINMEAPWLTFG